MSKDKQLKIVIIGPHSAAPGGTGISFGHLRRALEDAPDVKTVVVDSYGIRYAGVLAPFRLMRLLWRIAVAARTCDVITYQAMPTSLPYIGWYLPLVKWWFRKPLLFLSHGGMYYTELAWPGRLSAEFFIRRADMVLLQTRELMKLAADDGLERIEWFPTARPMPTEPVQHRGECRRFVYAGHLKTAKGLEYLARAAEGLPADASVDVYGPWHDLPRNTFVGRKRIQYVRALKPAEVVETLRTYDALVFPTFMPEEGHSGIILEAYAAGIPVIATRWKALPEIVDDGRTGLLIEPRSESAILDAMMRLYRDADLCRSLVIGAHAVRQQFSVSKQVERFLNACRQLVPRLNSVA